MEEYDEHRKAIMAVFSKVIELEEKRYATRVDMNYNNGEVAYYKSSDSHAPNLEAFYVLMRATKLSCLDGLLCINGENPSVLIGEVR